MKRIKNNIDLLTADKKTLEAFSKELSEVLDNATYDEDGYDDCCMECRIKQAIENVNKKKIGLFK